jgi:lysozyme
MDLIRRFEGLALRPYICPAGHLTIGYGHTNLAGTGPVVLPGDVWTPAQADAVLAATLADFAGRIWPLLTRAPTPGQWGAMVSLAYNIGVSAFARSTVLARFNAGDDAGARAAFALWNKAGGRVLRGLVARRAAEAALFAQDPGAVAPDRRPWWRRIIERGRE